MKTVLKKAVVSDLDAVVSLYRGAIGSPGCTWNEFYPTREDAKRDITAGGLYVLCADDTILATVSVVPENELDALPGFRKATVPREIARITVREDQRGKGLAHEMLLRLFDILRAEGTDAIRLLVAVGNPAALALYRGLGFTLLDTTEMYGNTYFAAEKFL